MASERLELLETALDRLKHQVQAVLDRQTTLGTSNIARIEAELEIVTRLATGTNKNVIILMDCVDVLQKASKSHERLLDHLDEALVTTQDEYEKQLLQLRTKQSALESRIEQLEADAATTRNALRVAITGPRVFVVEEAASSTPSASNTASGSSPSDSPRAAAPAPAQSPKEETRWDRRISE